MPQIAQWFGPAGTPISEPRKKTNGWFGTNWCGPGGSGPTLNELDKHCKAHDGCYDAHGLTWEMNANPFLVTAKQKRDLQACNQQLCNAARNLNIKGAASVVSYFST